ncbi:MAG: hypothetical protein A2145_04615 [candidate division Zixibacteria bacterium RBG_16_40_9]|nr:MAG: hypothetical protein A2145_04615 [candidate division Zixibacteria bacterium RBG_16_40_9]
MTYDILGIWVAAFFTLCIFSFLYRDNFFYKLAEHIFVGISAGYGVALQYHNVFLPNLWNPLTKEGKLILVIPFFLGALLFTRFLDKISWLSRWALALLIGIFSGAAIIGYGSGDLILQINANLLPLKTNSLLTSLNNLILTVGLIACLIYFFYSKEHKGGFGFVARIGIFFLMISFGASFGYTVMSRMSLLIGRVYFLLDDWLGILH